MKITDKNILDYIGNTPLIRLSGTEKAENISARLYAKAEYFNPAGSIKDRVAAAMIDDAEKRGILDKNKIIIEPTSGNTGVGIAAVAAVKGYHCVIVMPESMSEARRKLIASYGAELVLTSAAGGMTESVRTAEKLRLERNGIILGQFDNPVCREIHYKTTGPEIWKATQGSVDCLVAGVGTGGTISGTGKYLKEMNPCVKIAAVEPASSPLLTKGVSGAHKIQGIGANFIPKVLDRSVIDEVVDITDEEALEYFSLLPKRDGIFAGISSGAAVCAAVRLAKRDEFKNKNIVIILPDTGERY